MVERVVKRNLLGRLNARTPDDLERIARFWQVPVPGRDHGRHVGALYRTMTDVRPVRSIWEQLDADARKVILAIEDADARALTLPEIAERTGLTEDTARERAVYLFHAGILAREGDRQELPVGQLPRLFLPRELEVIFRRVEDEIEAGDLSGSSLRVLLEVQDDPELEETARIWGVRVIPGMRRRSELIAEILRQVGQAERIEQTIGARSQDALALLNVVREAASEGPMPMQEAIAVAGLSGEISAASSSNQSMRGVTQLHETLEELESSLLVMHTFRRDGTRWLFVPQEILQPGKVVTTAPLRPLQPLPEGAVEQAAEPRHAHAIAWDLMTITREVAHHGAPVWAPGEPISRSWQRRVNGRLWWGGDDAPPSGYLGFLLYLGLGANVLEPAADFVGAGAERHAIRPSVSSRIRSWRSRSFPEQTERLRDVWLAAEQWVEGRERQEIDVWGADWQGFRNRLLGALETIDPGTWVLVPEVAQRLAEQHPDLIGSTFSAATAAARPERGDRREARTAAIARIIEVELETAFRWLGLVEMAPAPGRGIAVRTTAVGRAMAADPNAGVQDADEASQQREGPTLAVTEEGHITLHRPAPIHIWSLSAFGDVESLQPDATYQLRPGSIGRALAAGFDLEHITTYLERQSGQALPQALREQLREWTAGYRRVRLQRAAVLQPDAGMSREQLVELVEKAGLTVLDNAAEEGDIVVLLPATGENGREADNAILHALRSAGYVGQWTVAPRNAEQGTT